MPLEDASTIDMATTPEDGHLELVITDSGQTTDPEERLQLLKAKLKTYVGYILSDEFTSDNPGVERDAVSIRVMCATGPGENMRGITEVRARGGELRIPIEFQQFP